MGQVLHGSARTTAAVRRAIQHSQESRKALAERHGVNPKIVAKWRKQIWYNVALHSQVVFRASYPLHFPDAAFTVA